jgi:hypothetical protein
MRFLRSHLALNLSILLLLVAAPGRGAASNCRSSDQKSKPVSKPESKPAATGPERYTGTWKGEYKGQTFAILKLKMDGQKLVGTIGFSQISINKDGEIQSVSGDVSDQTAIYDLKPSSDLLLFKHKDEDDVDELELKLKNDKEAELRFVNASAPSAGLKAPKPLQLTREAEKH